MLNSGIQPVSRKSLQLSDELGGLNSDFKRRFQIGKAKKRRPESVDAEPKIAVAPCSICGKKIALHALENHRREYHRPEPKQTKPRQLYVRTHKSTAPTMPPLLVSEAFPDTTPPMTELREECQLCQGNGCLRCEAGWVRKEKDQRTASISAPYVHDKSKISNADYVGSNPGAHFRERDGRIGSIPMYDDYGEESE